MDHTSQATLLVISLGAVMYLAVYFYFRMGDPISELMNESLINNFEECSKWQNRLSSVDLETYISLHQKCKRAKNMRYIAYYCGSLINGDCGGAGDRFRGMVLTFLFAMLTNRIFLIEWEKPFPLRDHFAPNLIDWRSPFINQKRFAYKISILDSACDRPELWKDEIMNSKETGIRLMTNCHARDHMWVLQNIFSLKVDNSTTHQKELEFLLVYGTLIKTLFHPSDHLKNRTQQIAKDIGLDIVFKLDWGVPSPIIGLTIQFGTLLTKL